METLKPSWLEKHITLHSYDDEKAEKENAMTHVIGAILAVIALIIIFARTSQLPSFGLKAGMIVWGFTMLLLYSASAMYHHLPHNDAKRFCRILDHSNIYFLIAGTYTPMLMYVGTPLAHTLLLAVWLIAALGIAFTLIFWGKLGPLHVILYLAMGWLIVFFWGSIIPYFPKGLTTWVFAAGITYSVGVIFYANKKLPHYHAIWHLFCIAGSALFFIGYMLLLY
ncbi:hemolysin III family protein [uncultured Sphaerochaeta sp.]|uniref:PAQR family membrane homeostasis protein TrhA n=1 Tax=uncultured Sphaerochaeta sp. TaxID=886478 RepID=UPI002A0A6728|nr:hemolysin III family protein [uncultured Sphaerochaeta sp.]